MARYNFNFEGYKYYIDSEKEISKKQLQELEQILPSFPHASNSEWRDKFLQFSTTKFNPDTLFLAANAYDFYGNTMLGVACEDGYSVEAVQKLINLGANLDAPDHNMKKLPLHWAINNKKSFNNLASEEAVAVVACLLQNGARTDIICYDKMTPLGYAKDRGFIAAAELLSNHHGKKKSLKRKHEEKPEPSAADVVVKTELKEIGTFLNKDLKKTLKALPPLSPYPVDRDGGLNPALKIFSSTNQNQIANGRWEIFVLLENERGNVSFRSGVKTETWDYDDLRIVEQFNFSSFAKPANAIIENLKKYRSGHPSLALDFSALDKGIYKALPVFAGGWIIRNDNPEKRLQVYWSSGRYQRDLAKEELHIVELCVAFNLMAEYGRDFIVEFYQYSATTMTDFITQKSRGGVCYDWTRIIKEARICAAIEVLPNAYSSNYNYPIIKALKGIEAITPSIIKEAVSLDKNLLITKALIEIGVPSLSLKDLYFIRESNIQAFILLLINQIKRVPVATLAARDEITLYGLARDGIVEGVEALIQRGAHERPLGSLFLGIHSSHFLGCDLFEIEKFKKRIADNLAGKNENFRLNPDHFKIAVLLLQHPNEQLEKIFEDHYLFSSLHFLPFFAWAAKNNRADLFDIPHFKKLFEKAKDTIKEAVVIAAAFGSIDFLTTAVQHNLMDPADIEKALSIAAGSGNVMLLTPLMELSEHNKDKRTEGYLTHTMRQVSGIYYFESLGKPLFWAVRKGYCNIAEILLKAKASPNEIRGFEKDSYLQLATRCQNTRMMKLLLSYGAKIDHQDILGHTALHSAADNKDLEALKVLIAAGAQNLPDGKGIKALDKIRDESMRKVLGLDKVMSVENVVNDKAASNKHINSSASSWSPLAKVFGLFQTQSLGSPGSKDLNSQVLRK